MSKKTVLLTGASGSVGQEALKELLNRRDKYNIRVLSIPDKHSLRALKKYEKDMDIFWGDISDRSIVELAVKDVDFVIHLAAVIPPTADHKIPLAEKVNVGGTENIIESIKRFAPKAFLLFSSSVSIYGDRVDTPWINVTDPLIPSEGDFYADTKIRCEQKIIDSNLKWSIFRFSAIMGENQKLDPLFFHMPLNTSLELATTKDTGYAVVEAIEHEAALQWRIFNLGGGEKCRVTYKEFLDKNFKIRGLDFEDFPPEAFAERNFHCGYFEDSHELEQILHFQRDTLEDLYRRTEEKNSVVQKWITVLFRKQIARYIVKYSDPLNARNKNQEKLINKFYKDI